MVIVVLCQSQDLFVFVQALGLHAHEDEGHGAHDSHEEEDNGFVWKALVVLAAIYGFFLFETLMHLGLKSKIGEHGGHSHVDAEVSSLLTTKVLFSALDTNFSLTV